MNVCDMMVEVERGCEFPNVRRNIINMSCPYKVSRSTESKYIAAHSLTDVMIRSINLHLQGAATSSRNGSNNKRERAEVPEPPETRRSRTTVISGMRPKDVLRETAQER